MVQQLTLSVELKQLRYHLQSEQQSAMHQKIWEQSGIGAKHQLITSRKLEMTLSENLNHWKISERELNSQNLCEEMMKTKPPLPSFDAIRYASKIFVGWSL